MPARTTVDLQAPTPTKGAVLNTRRTALIVLSLSLALLALGAGYALAQTGGVINACVSKGGTLRIVADPECKKNETLLSWNSTGPQDLPGELAPANLYAGQVRADGTFKGSAGVTVEHPSVGFYAISVAMSTSCTQLLYPVIQPQLSRAPAIEVTGWGVTPDNKAYFQVSVAGPQDWPFFFHAMLIPDNPNCT